MFRNLKEMVFLFLYVKKKIHEKTFSIKYIYNFRELDFFLNTLFVCLF